MPDTPSITINKRMDYRGQPEVWSNTYHFSGTVPSNDTEWKALADAVWAAEAPILVNRVTYAGYLGYQAGNEHAVSIADNYAEGLPTPAGSLGNLTSADITGGDTAFWVRWATPDRTSRGKRIYLRKYFHPGVGNYDVTLPTLVTAAQTYGNKMKDGTLPGGAKICGPQGAVAGAVKVSPFITTRTLKRRGKRPSR